MALLGVHFIFHVSRIRVNTLYDFVSQLEFHIMRWDMQVKIFLISNFRRVLYVVCFLLGNSPASECYMPTFRNTLLHLHRQVGV